jgi:hypothetical protein
METNVLEMLAIVGLEFWNSHLIGNAPPSHTRRWERMRNPRPGDLVIEISTSGLWRHGSKYRSPSGPVKMEIVIGVLKKITNEPFPLDEPWDEDAEGRSEPLEECVYINALHDSSEHRWTNANFVTILPVEGWR